MARRLAAVLTAVAVGTTAVPLLAAPAQAAFEAGVAFTAADLPTWQTNGIVWAAAESDGLVFAGGTFNAVRPPRTLNGDPASLPRTNLAVLDGATGEPTDCVLDVTGSTTPTVRALDVSPDGRTLYVGGSFTAVDGVPRQHLAAVDIATCTVVPGFAPLPSGTVRAVDSTSTAVYYGGALLSVNGQARSRAAAAGAVGSGSPGALLPWAPVLDKEVRAIAVRPDGSEVVVGGDFDTVNGAASNALGVVDPTAGANAFVYPGFIEPESAVKDIAVDATGFYTGHEGTGFQKLDGRIALDWSTHAERWRDTCLGATQAVVSYRGLLYSGSHAHDCTTMDEFPDGPRQHLLAQSVDGPALLPWFPQTNGGTGEALGPRDLVVSSGPGGDFLWVVGEFTTVNGVAQQGLTRFGSGSAQAGPATPTPSVTSVRAGEARVSWRQSFDKDDATLTYRVFRDKETVPFHTETVPSWFWARRQMTVVDRGLAPGSSHTYRVEVTDGNRTAIASRSVTIASQDSAYASRVLADGATSLWRFSERADVFFSDTSASLDGLTLKNAGSPGAAGALVGEPDTALTLSGTTATLHTEQRAAPPGAFSVETWFKTTTTRGGKLIGFGDKQSVPSRNFDRHVYMTDAGKLVFGAYNGAVRALTTPAAYNDGEWHHVVATQGSGGMALYVDGNRVASGTATTAGKVAGYWRVGGDNIACRKTTCAGIVWPTPPTSEHFAGTLDETAVYASALPAATVAAHYTLGSGTAPVDVEAPSVPQDVSVGVSGSVPTVSWSASTDAGSGVAGYQVHRSTSSGFAVSDATRVGAVTGTSFTDSSLAAGTYYYRVVAQDVAGNLSAASAQAAGTVASTPPPPAEPTVVTVAPSEDSYANEGAAGTSYGTSSSLAARASKGLTSYLRFVVPAAPEGTVLTGAQLRVRTSSDSTAGSADVAAIGFAGESWTETGLTWNNRPALQGAAFGQLRGASAPNTVYTTALDVAALQGLPGTTRTVAVSGSGSDSLWFWSRNHATSSYRPALVLSYTAGSTSPEPSPDTTAPSVPQDVSVGVAGSVPTVSWSASTDSGSGVAGYEVHRSTSSGFAVSDATRVGAVTGTSFTDSSLAAGTYYYRVVAQDGAGNLSAASAQAAGTVASTTTTPPPAEATVVTVAPSADSYANEGAAGTSYGTSSSLGARASKGMTSYLRFAVPAAPAGTVLTGAQLRVRTTSDSTAGSADVAAIGFAGDSWTETGLTWSNRPALQGAAFGQLRGASAPNTVYTTSLDVAALQGLPGTTRTVAVSGTGSDSLWFWSRNHSNSGYRPALVLTYS